MRPEPTNAPAALSRRFSVAPMMDRSN
ncbi:hypothetical protein, partial [Pseudomonas aeruginosa]